MMENYRTLLMDWREHENYNVGMYVVYEDLMDVTKGPNVLRDIGYFIKDAGFDVTLSLDDGDRNGDRNGDNSNTNENGNDNNVHDHLQFAWYNSIGGERIEQYRTNNYDYNDYVPGFTKRNRNR